ncbi:hypothetical protein LPJ73_002286 [Coemansia sp. RSA 2703]|nr:hypothetical protein LPJ73_002286 [Coemansia sp. RSA 2703]KAJ2394193.1 hypothetical protein GGI05_002144 [Coemansia sp. RSA 2603]
MTDHSSDEDDSEVLFVPEDEYMPLEEDDEIDSDTFNSNRIPQDLERMLDERLDAEMDLKSMPAADNTEHKASSTPITKSEEDVAEHKPDPLQVTVAAPMSAEHINHIRNVMAGIQLNEDAIPEWAKRVPESAWMPRRQEQQQQDSDQNTSAPEN